MKTLMLEKRWGGGGGGEGDRGRATREPYKYFTCISSGNWTPYTHGVKSNIYLVWCDMHGARRWPFVSTVAVEV